MPAAGPWLRSSTRVATPAVRSAEMVIAGVSSITTRILDLGGAINRPISCGNVPVLPGDAVTHRILELPFSDRKRLEQTVPFELDELRERFGQVAAEFGPETEWQLLDSGAITQDEFDKLKAKALA